MDVNTTQLYKEKWVIAGFDSLTSNVDGKENVVLHMGDIQLEDGKRKVLSLFMKIKDQKIKMLKIHKT